MIKRNNPNEIIQNNNERHGSYFLRKAQEYFAKQQENILIDKSFGLNQSSGKKKNKYQIDYICWLSLNLLFRNEKPKYNNFYFN